MNNSFHLWVQKMSKWKNFKCGMKVFKLFNSNLSLNIRYNLNLVFTPMSFISKSTHSLNIHSMTAYLTLKTIGILYVYEYWAKIITRLANINMSQNCLKSTSLDLKFISNESISNRIKYSETNITGLSMHRKWFNLSFIWHRT